jgi:asparagine synthase (glutamine-hydrolysing)
MCGIFGILAPDVDPGLLEGTARALGHRGPDNASVWTDSGVGLLHTRLSLVDLDARSNQPFWDEARRFALVFNGEIYNFRELRRDLEQQGVTFRTSGDTEVLMAMIVHEGVERSLKRLEGMFAFGLYDTATRSLVLARDRFGMKPIVYHQSPGKFVFASEVKALRPWVPIEPDLTSVSAYLAGFHSPTSGASMFKDIRLLPPGTLLTLKPGEAPQLEQFASIAGLWDPGERERLEGLSPSQVVDELEARLFDGVRSQLLADAPVGVFCSGGVDSSIVVAMASTLHSNLAIFHADVVGRHSERDAAEMLARHLRLDLRVVEVRDSDFIDALPSVIAHSERPISYRPDSIPFFRVCELVREHGVKGVLSGEGSDECFLGYQAMMPRLSALWNRLPRPTPAGARNLYRRLVLGKHAEFETRDERPDLSRSITSRFEVELLKLENRALRDAQGAPLAAGDLKTLDYLGYHLRTLLHRNDTLGMAASIESRFPILDTSVVRFAVNLPYEYKIRRTMTPGDMRHPFFCDKWIIREVARRRIPKALSQRPKRAFPTNAFKRMRIDAGFFRESRVADCLALGPAERTFLAAQARAVFQQRLLQLEVWMRVCVDGTDAGLVREGLQRHVTIGPDRGEGASQD